MEYKSVGTIIDVGDNRTVTGFAAITGNVDSGFDKIFKGAFRKTIKERLDRVRHLWQHDFNSPPIAKIESLKELKADSLPEELRAKYPEATGGLQVVRKYLNTDRAEEVFQGLAEGVINEMSFGFDPIKFDFEEDEDEKILIRNLREVRLWDTSDVNWGMNDATVAVSAKAVPFKDTGVAKSDAEWVKEESLVAYLEDLSSWDMRPTEKTRIAAHYAWASDPVESLDDLLYLHHEPSLKEVGAVNWTGLKAAMKELMVGDNSPSVEERKLVYTHLAKHYKQFEMVAPDFQIVEIAASTFEILAVPELLDEMLGRTLSSLSSDRLLSALADLQEILLVEPDAVVDEKTATLTRNILARIAIAERDVPFSIQL